MIYGGVFLHIQYNSKKIKKGDIFIAIGNGHKYVEEAIINGASKVIVEYGKYSVPTKKIFPEDFFGQPTNPREKDLFNNIKLIS